MDVSSSKSTSNNWHLTLKLNTQHPCVYSMCLCDHVCYLFLPIDFFLRRMLVWSVWSLYVCLCVYMRMSIYYLSWWRGNQTLLACLPPEVLGAGLLVLPWCFVSYGSTITRQRWTDGTLWCSISILMGKEAKKCFRLSGFSACRQNMFTYATPTLDSIWSILCHS